MSNSCEWPEVLLDDVAFDITVGHVGLMASEYVSSGIPFLRSQNVEPFRINLEDIKFITQEFHKRLRKSALLPGDVVIVRTGKPGASAVIPETLPISNCSDLVIVHPGPNLDSKFLAFYINSIASKEVSAQLVGAVQQHFNVGSARNLKIRLPPLPEQRAIARILGTLDDKIEANRRMNETLEALARTLFKSWFVDFDPVRARAEGRAPAGMDAETAALFPDSFEETELGMVPSGWRVGSFDETIELIGGGTPKTSEPEYWNGDIPWFSVVDAPENSNVFVIDTEKKITKRGLEESSTRLLLKGTTIITARGTVGKCALVGNPMTMNQSCYGVRAKDQRGNYFNYFALRNLVSELQRSTHGSVFDTITSETFKTIQVAIVPIELTRIFDKKISLFMERILCSLHESDTIITLRNLLLSKLLSGEIRLKDYEVIAEAK